MDLGLLPTITRATVEQGLGSAFIATQSRRKGAKQKIREFAALVKLIRGRKPRVVLEIGTFHGGTLWAWCRVAAPDALIVSVDLPGGRFGGGYQERVTEQLRGYAQPGQTLRLLRADSHSLETLEQVERILEGRTVDFAFIDGDHTYEGVKRDFELYGPLVNGLVAFHDVLPHNTMPACQVDRLWAELQPCYETMEFVDPTDLKRGGIWGGIGVLTTDTSSP